MTPASGQSWLVPALGGALFIGLHYAFVRAAAGRIGDSLGALVLEGTAAVGIFLAYTLGPRGALVATTRPGVVYSVISGTCISCASILLFMALRRGGPVATTGTIVLGGGVTLSAMVAPWIFGEAFTARRALGVLLGVLAILVLSGDSSAVESAGPP